MKKPKYVEDGNSISYAMYFAVIVLGIMIFSFCIFHFDLYVLEEMLENRLHIVEGAVLTTNQSTIVDGTKNDPYERELIRTHIITECDATTAYMSMGSKEYEQVYGLARNFENAFKKENNLVNKTKPSEDE